MNIDEQNRITVTEYRGNKVAVFDTRAEKFTEYDLPPRTYPYRANFDGNGELWVSTMHTDRVVRLDPKTGNAVQYLMPSETNMRTVFVDKSTTPTTFWVGSNHDHRIVKVEPLDRVAAPSRVRLPRARDSRADGALITRPAHPSRAPCGR